MSTNYFRLRPPVTKVETKSMMDVGPGSVVASGNTQIIVEVAGYHAGILVVDDRDLTEMLRLLFDPYDVGAHVCNLGPGIGMSVLERLGASAEVVLLSEDGQITTVEEIRKKLEVSR